jgi:hypothetical protein
MSVAEVAAHFRRSKRTIRRWPWMPPVVLGNLYLRALIELVPQVAPQRGERPKSCAEYFEIYRSIEKRLHIQPNFNKDEEPPFEI